MNGRALAGATAKSAAPDGELERLASLLEHIAREELDKQKAAEEASGALTSKVTAIATPPNGGLVVTLENGQVWQQKTADRGMHIKVGDQVTIKHALMGSFLLTSDTVKGSMRVSRVK